MNLKLADLLDLYAGQTSPATIDFLKRPEIKNDDGSVSTLLQNVVGFDKDNVIVPSIVDGKKLGMEEAIKSMKKTGQHGGVFDSPEAADAAARFRTFILGEMKK